jgi:hypothetical protein
MLKRIRKGWNPDLRRMHWGKVLTILACSLIGGSAAALKAVISPPAVIAHGGSLDSLGCHNDRQQGNYHCHQGTLLGRTFSSQAQAREAMATVGGAPAPTPQPAPSPRSAATPIPVSGAASVPYDRDMYPTWRDEDGDCQDARQEVLIAESLQFPQMDDRECRVVSGRWFDPYTSQTFTDPGDLDIDHMVPLAEAHRSGGDEWSAARRLNYANDLFHVDSLIAVSANANRSEGDRDPAQWLPSNQSYHCEYVRKWVVIKATWSLEMDAAEALTITDLLRGCP